MLQNSLCRLSEAEWFGVLLRANALRRTYKGRRWVALRASEDGQIPEDLPVLLYVNHAALRHRFFQTSTTGWRESRTSRCRS